MGLDMYLERMPRFRGCTAKQIVTVNNYFDWKEAKANGSKYANCTLEQWFGTSYKDVPKAAINFYKPFFVTRYSYWDTDHKYGYKSIIEDVGYWRKANAIHKWFVDNIQDGEDDCGYYEVAPEYLEELLNICKLIKQKCVMKKGKIANGYRFENGKEVPIMEDGEYIENPEVAAKYLPTQSGFFFGGTEYDQWYMEDIDSTIEILTEVLKETDFDHQMVVYTSSW